MTTQLQRASAPLRDYVGDRFMQWRTGSMEGQIAVLTGLIAITVAMTAVSLVNYGWMPGTAFLIPILLGRLALRYRPLVVLVAISVLAVTATVTKQGLQVGRLAAMVALAIAAFIILYEASRSRTGLPGPLGEAMLVDLKDRLQSQGRIPSLPQGWRAQSSMISSGGAQFAGDFLVANLSEDENHLEMVLVDVCGKGVAAGTQSLQFAGALGGLIGALPPLGLFAAANDFLLRQHWDDGFATAVHVLVNLKTGDYSIINAGHPPALHWNSNSDEWEIDSARGTALGIKARPDFHLSTGRIGWGNALMFYTDGVVESHSLDFSTGIEMLRRTAKAVVAGGFDNATKKILAGVAAGNDDRAVLILSREL